MTTHNGSRPDREERRPRPPFGPQKIPPPGLESDLEPRPAYEAPAYKAAGKLEGKRALIAPAYVFLASDADSSYITGIVLPILGGETIGG